LSNWNGIVQTFLLQPDFCLFMESFFFSVALYLQLFLLNANNLFQQPSLRILHQSHNLCALEERALPQNLNILLNSHLRTTSLSALHRLPQSPNSNCTLMESGKTHSAILPKTMASTSCASSDPLALFFKLSLISSSVIWDRPQSSLQSISLLPFKAPFLKS
jgi:hypothetical protein